VYIEMPPFLRINPALVVHYNTFPKAWKYGGFSDFSNLLHIREKAVFFGKIVLVNRH